MDKQMTMSAIQDELREARTRKKEFLEQIERIVPWKEWRELIRPCYYKGEHGNKPYELEKMIRIHVLQNLYDLSDKKTSDEIQDSRAFSEFCGIDSSNQAPDGDTIGRFRNILVNNGLQEMIFSQVIELLSKRGLILKKGTIVDSTIIAAASSTKNKEHRRDPDAHQVKKGNQWYFGFRAHTGVDRDTGIVHTVVVTAANTSEVTVASGLLHGEEESVHGDSGYTGVQKRPEAKRINKQGKKIRYKIARKPSSYKKNSPQSQGMIRRWEREKASIRSKVEHVYAVVKNQLGFRKTRYRGLRKQTSKLNMMFALANLILADRPCLAA